MKCENYSKWISLYIDHQLKENDLKTFQTHLNHCTSCQEEVEILRGIVNGISTLEKIELPNGFHEQLMEKIKQENQSKQQDTVEVFKKNKKWYFNWRVGSAVAAVFVFSILFFDIPHTNRPKEAMPESASIQQRSFNMEETAEDSPKMASDITQEDATIDTFDLGKAAPVTWEIQTKEYEKGRENIIQIMEEIEGIKTVVTDTEPGDTNNPQFVIEITLEKSQKDLLLSKVTETYKNDIINFQENDKKLEEGFMETLMITIHEIN